MIVECYTADVYCDCPRHEYQKPGCSSTPDVFTGRNKRETDTARKQAGWVRVNGKDICPLCMESYRSEVSVALQGCRRTK